MVAVIAFYGSHFTKNPLSLPLFCPNKIKKSFLQKKLLFA
jgi:hypothetical protein